jgi:hypothetical protein
VSALSSIAGLLEGLADGLIGSAIFASVYNLTVRRHASKAP